MDLTKPIKVETEVSHGGPGYLAGTYRLAVSPIVHTDHLLAETEAYRGLFEAAPKMLGMLRDICAQNDYIDPGLIRALIAEIEGGAE